MPIDTRLIELLVCPVCKGPLLRGEGGDTLVCPADRLAFPIRDGIPVMLESEASNLDTPEPAPMPLGGDAAAGGTPDA